MLGISKRGKSYLRRLFVQGARSVMQQRHRQARGLSCWLAQLLAGKHQNVAVVALANKLVRMAWAVLCKERTLSRPRSGCLHLNLGSKKKEIIPDRFACETSRWQWVDPTLLGRHAFRRTNPRC